ncbi:MAG TPA: DUF262 domain-containing protein [Candidatus Rifleibacterium sp.]|nr:DUF262 domain-containing protein [Candidatus Rifleibacterium sp.]
MKSEAKLESICGSDEKEEILFENNSLLSFAEDDETSEPAMQEPFNPSEINIISRPDSLHNLIERLNHNEIDMNTDFQRHADLWDNQKMSRLIESILIRFPLPAFYFDASYDEKWLIVDGLQRLSSIKKFVIDKKLKLSGLEYLQDFNGKGYDDLPRTYRRRIDECPVTLFLIQPGTPEPVKYSIFRRINTGGLTLNDQEIRNAMASERIRKYLEELANDEVFVQTMGDQSRRMVDQEMVLRYMAFRFMDYEQSKKNISTFLDEMIAQLENGSSEKLIEYEHSFKIAIRRCWELFGRNAFEKASNGDNLKRRRKNATLFEVWTNALSRLSESDMAIVLASKESLLERYNELMLSDNDFLKSITYSTQKKDHYRIRRDKIDQLLKDVVLPSGLS